jgi:hypothetical protein
MRTLWKIADFGRAMHRQLRFGELSRAPLRLLRVEWKGDVAECDWMARPADEWDDHLPRHLREEHVTFQALQDAVAVRELLFSALPGVESASLRVFRQSAAGAPDLIIKGTVTRGQEIPRNISSAAMRAKLLGLQFWLEDGMLEALPSEEYAVSF